MWKGCGGIGFSVVFAVVFTFKLFKSYGAGGVTFEYHGLEFYGVGAIVMYLSIYGVLAGIGLYSYFGIRSCLSKSDD